MSWPAIQIAIEYTAGTWTDVTASVLGDAGSTLERGTSRVSGPIPDVQPGSLTLSFRNGNRGFDPTTQANLRTGKRIRVQAVWSATTHSLFVGFIRSIHPQYGDGLDAVTTITADDAVGWVSRADELGGLVRPAEPSGTRINAILDAVGWGADRLIDTGTSTLQAATLTGNPWAAVQACVHAELSDLWVDGTGRITFRSRANLRSAAIGGASILVASPASTGEVESVGIEMAIDDQQVFNDVRVTRNGGVAQRGTNSTSITAYGPHGYSLSGIDCVDDYAAQAIAQQIVELCKDAEVPRFESVTLNGAASDSWWVWVLSIGISSVITVRKRPPGGGAVIDIKCFVRGVRHDFGYKAWTTTWSLQGTSRYVLPASAWTLDDAGTLDQLDAGRILIY